MTITPSTEDRAWAAICHLSSLGFGMGILLPIVGWSDQRRKSNYASFQCLQALGYQSLGFTVWALSYLILIIIAFLILLALFTARSGTISVTDPALRIWIIMISGVLLGFLLIYSVLPVIAAVGCAFGQDVRYPILGDRLARYLAYDPSANAGEQVWLTEDHEFRWVAATGHFSILIVVWGMLAPLTTWMLYGRQNPFLRFQSIQTLVYQAGTTMLYFAALCLYLFGFFAFLLPTGFTGEPNLDSPATLLGLIVFGLTLLIVLIILLFVPLLHILGQWAGVRVLKGEDYYYPVIGKLVKRWIAPKIPLAADSSLSPKGKSP